MTFKILIPGMMPSFRQTLARKSYSPCCQPCRHKFLCLYVCLYHAQFRIRQTLQGLSLHKGEMPFLLERAGWDLTLMLIAAVFRLISPFNHFTS